jgi:hypothetical protein
MIFLVSALPEALRKYTELASNSLGRLGFGFIATRHCNYTLGIAAICLHLSISFSPPISDIIVSRRLVYLSASGEPLQQLAFQSSMLTPTAPYARVGSARSLFISQNCVLKRRPQPPTPSIRVVVLLTICCSSCLFFLACLE